mmetsp:Transcript_21829/g.33923  ORF Transcript_21829/g.33923 Transcript_21829/m.33923 type:complete len:306 (+) Transcript_21829:215-1132(+)
MDNLTNVHPQMSVVKGMDIDFSPTKSFFECNSGSINKVIALASEVGVWLLLDHKDKISRRNTRRSFIPAAFESHLGSFFVTRLDVESQNFGDFCVRIGSRGQLPLCDLQAFGGPMEKVRQVNVQVSDNIFGFSRCSKTTASKVKPAAPTAKVKTAWSPSGTRRERTSPSASHSTPHSTHSTQEGSKRVASIPKEVFEKLFLFPSGSKMVGVTAWHATHASSATASRNPSLQPFLAKLIVNLFLFGVTQNIVRLSNLLELLLSHLEVIRVLIRVPFSTLRSISLLQSSLICASRYTKNGIIIFAHS